MWNSYTVHVSAYVEKCIDWTNYPSHWVSVAVTLVYDWQLHRIS